MATAFVSIRESSSHLVVGGNYTIKVLVLNQATLYIDKRQTKRNAYLINKCVLCLLSATVWERCYDGPILRQSLGVA